VIFVLGEMTLKVNFSNSQTL